MDRGADGAAPPGELARSLRRITIAGCLAMVYFAGVGSPAAADFFRAVGASDIHFGLLSGIPLFMVALQFAGAAAANHLRERKRPFMALLIVGRLLYVPVVLVPLAAPAACRPAALVASMALIAASSALGSFATPIWLSWMADLIPGRILSRYWGTRQSWMAWCSTGCSLAIALYTFLVPLPITVAFALLVAVAVASGVVDIALFARVHEPKHRPPRGQPMRVLLLEPLRHADYRTFVFYSCAWAASVWFAAAFMVIYVLHELHVPVWEANLIWCVPGVGVALAAPAWGRIADRRGNKPLLTVCTTVKPLIVLVFFFLTRGNVAWVLPLALLLDGTLNAGNAVATNGYMMKVAPQANRPMFMAALTGFAGMCGGLGAILGGVFLERWADFSVAWLGRTWNRYHLLFAIGFLLRVGCVILLRWVREPRSSSPGDVLQDLTGMGPLRWLRFPAGLNRERPESPEV